MLVLLVTLLILICLCLLGGLFVRPITHFVQCYWSHFTYEGDQFLLWSGLLLSALGIGLLVMYLVLRL
jgi:hypothetical protein